VLKGKVESVTGRKRFTLRSTLVVVQFALSIALIVGTMLTLRQLDFMRSKNIGFDKEQVILVPLNQTANEKYNVFKTELLKAASISNVTGSYQRLGNNIHQMGLRAEGDNEIRQLAISHLSVDFNFLSFYGIELIEGREFSKDFPTDSGQAFVVNEALAREMGWDEPVGKRMAFGSNDSMGTVIGLVSDFNYNSLHHKIEPLAMSVQDYGYNELSVRVEGAAISDAIEHIESVWNELVPDRPFQYNFLDDHFAELYKSDQQVMQVVGLLALLAVFIACLGLFGLASITADHRIKEMGIRKVMGASVTELTVLMVRGFVGLVFAAFLVATPLAYFLMRRWLESFAFHIEIDILIFIYAGILAMVIAVLTVGHRAIATARANPVHALRYE
jgi:putative ABC transport system permease protein